MAAGKDTRGPRPRALVRKSRPAELTFVARPDLDALACISAAHNDAIRKAHSDRKAGAA